MDQTNMYGPTNTCDSFAPNLQVETAGDCYIVAGSLMTEDREGFLALENDTMKDALEGAERVMAYATVSETLGDPSGLRVPPS